MNLRELANKDAAVTIEGEQAGNTLCTLSDGAREWEVPMILSDIGYAVDTEGNRIAGRTCWATYIMNRVKNEDEKILIPRRGWRINWTDIDGNRQEMFVSFAEPDKTIGWVRLFMVVQLGAES